MTAESKEQADLPSSIHCPSCGCYAFLDGDTYYCDHCGWSEDAANIDIKE